MFIHMQSSYIFNMCIHALTNNHPDLAAAVLVIAGNHGRYCIIHHGNHIHLKVL